MPARTAQAGSARFGGMRLGLPTAGDGTTTATWVVETDRGGGARLRIVLDPATDALSAAELTAAARFTPPEGW